MLNECLPLSFSAEASPKEHLPIVGLWLLLIWMDVRLKAQKRTETVLEYEEKREKRCYCTEVDVRNVWQVRRHTDSEGKGVLMSLFLAWQWGPKKEWRQRDSDDYVMGLQDLQEMWSASFSLYLGRTTDYCYFLTHLRNRDICLVDCEHLCFCMTGVWCSVCEEDWGSGRWIT